MKGGNFLKQNKEVLCVENFRNEYKYVVRSIWAQYAADSDDQPITKQYVVLKIKNIETKSEVIHPLTEFILINWKHLSFNTMKSSANTVVMFLNFLIDNKKYYNLKSLHQLELLHGTAFLNELTYKKTPKQTVKRHETILDRYFDFLLEKKIINYEVKEQKMLSNTSKTNVLKSPFVEVEYYQSNTHSSIHQLPDEYILRFLEVAYQLNSCISLAVYMQFFGGLRTGEICNLRVKDVQLLGSYGEEGFILNLTQDRHL